MFDDGVKGQGKDEEVKVQDIAEILWEALENEDTNGPRSAASSTSVSEPGHPIRPPLRSGRGLGRRRFVDLVVGEQLATGNCGDAVGPLALRYQVTAR